MIGLGLRLVVNGGREAVARLVILTVAVGLGVGLLLTALAATNAAVTWNNRHAWFWTGTSTVAPGTAAAGTAPLWWHPVGDFFDGQQIERFDVAATGPYVPGAAWPSPRPGPGHVLRLARAGRADAQHARRASSPTATPATWQARSATPRCRRRTRWSSSSGARRFSWRTRRTPCR